MPTAESLLHHPLFSGIEAEALRRALAQIPASQSRFEPGNVIQMPYSRERLAELFGVARPSLSRVLGEMASEGIVALAGRRVAVKDRGALVRTVDQSD